MSLPKIEILMEGTEPDERVRYVMDPNRFMYSEVVLLEDQCGLSTADLSNQLFQQNPPARAIGAMVWLVMLRANAAKDGISIDTAAEALPFATLDFNMAGMEVRAVPMPDPTPPADRTPATRTSRSASAKPGKKRATTASSG